MDASMYRAVNRFAARTPWMHGFFVAMAHYGIVLFAVALLASWWTSRRADSLDGVLTSVWAGAAALVALEAAQLIGSAVGRARPFVAMPDAHVLIARSSDVSFPSDHATVAGAVAAGVLLAGLRVHRVVLGIVTCALALVLAASRVYTGVHYPGDVVAGLALGAAVATAGLLPALIVLRRLAGVVERTPARVLLHTRSPHGVEAMA